MKSPFFQKFGSKGIPWSTEHKYLPVVLLAILIFFCLGLGQGHRIADFWKEFLNLVSEPMNGCKYCDWVRNSVHSGQTAAFPNIQSERVKKYCTILINSSRGVTCDRLAEIFASARRWWACDGHQILATAWGACIPCDAPKRPFGFSSQPDSLWQGTSNRFRPKPLGLWCVMAELIKIVQYAKWWIYLCWRI